MHPTLNRTISPCVRDRGGFVRTGFTVRARSVRAAAFVYFPTFATVHHHRRLRVIPASYTDFTTDTHTDIHKTHPIVQRVYNTVGVIPYNLTHYLYFPLPTTMAW